MAIAEAVTVEVKLPELTVLLLNALRAVMSVPEDWTPECTLTVGDLCSAVADALLPGGEHNEEVCSTGLVVCPECASCSDGEVA